MVAFSSSLFVRRQNAHPNHHPHLLKTLYVTYCNPFSVSPKYRKHESESNMISNYQWQFKIWRENMRNLILLRSLHLPLKCFSLCMVTKFEFWDMSMHELELYPFKLAKWKIRELVKFNVIVVIKYHLNSFSFAEINLFWKGYVLNLKSRIILCFNDSYGKQCICCVRSNEFRI